MDHPAFNNFPVLKTPNLVLRQVTADDLLELIPIVAYKTKSDSPDAALEVLHKIDLDYQARKTLNWGLTIADKVIGTCGFYRGFENQTGEVGYVMREEFRRRGWMQEAVEAATNFGFNELGLREIVAFTADDNFGSVKLLENLRFVKTGEVVDGSRKFQKKNTDL